MMFKDFSLFLNEYGDVLMRELQSSSPSGMSETISRIEKILLGFWRVLHKFLASKLVNFSIFTLFGDATFERYLQTNLSLKYLLFQRVFDYPKLAAVFVSNLLVISENFIETVFALDHGAYAVHLFNISMRMFEKITGGGGGADNL